MVVWLQFQCMFDFLWFLLLCVVWNISMLCVFGRVCVIVMKLYWLFMLDIMCLLFSVFDIVVLSVVVIMQELKKCVWWCCRCFSVLLLLYSWLILLMWCMLIVWYLFFGSVCSYLQNFGEFRQNVLCRYLFFVVRVVWLIDSVLLFLMCCISVRLLCILCLIILVCIRWWKFLLSILLQLYRFILNGFILLIFCMSGWLVSCGLSVCSMWWQCVLLVWCSISVWLRVLVSVLMLICRVLLLCIRVLVYRLMVQLVLLIGCRGSLNSVGYGGGGVIIRLKNDILIVVELVRQGSCGLILVISNGCGRLCVVIVLSVFWVMLLLYDSES